VRAFAHAIQRALKDTKKQTSVNRVIILFPQILDIPVNLQQVVLFILAYLKTQFYLVYI